MGFKNAEGTGLNKERGGARLAAWYAAGASQYLGVVAQGLQVMEKPPQVLVWVLQVIA